MSLVPDVEKFRVTLRAVKLWAQGQVSIGVQSFIGVSLDDLWAVFRQAAAQRSSEELLTLADNAQSGPAPLLAVAGAMVAGIRAAIGPDLVAISAGNYGGKLGKFHFHLHQLLLTA